MKIKMGHVKVKTKLWNLEKTKSKEIDAIVDTGATLTVIPEKTAKELELTVDPLTGRLKESELLLYILKRI